MDAFNQVKDELSDIDRRFIERVEIIISENYSRSEFGTSELSEALNLSERHLQRKLKGIVGCLPNEYLRSFRLNKAYESLTQGSAIKAVAYDCGFSSISYFSTC